MALTKSEEFAKKIIELADEKMIFISERIVNIAELENLICMSKLSLELLADELEKTAPSKEKIDSAVRAMKDGLEKAERFEFCIEKRMCKFKEDCESPIN